MGARLTILVLQSSCESHVTVEVGTDKFKSRAAQVSGSERARLFDAAAKLLPLFADYQTRPSGKFPSSRCRASIEFGLYERLPLTRPFLSTALCVECRDWNSFKRSLRIIRRYVTSRRGV
jgi:F420H(2)-dependent quinone reductase